MPPPTTPQLADALRVLAMDCVEKAASGHPGMPMGMADVATVLFQHHLRFCAHAPKWHDRDRFILSAGHGSALLYSLLHLTGYTDFPLSQLQQFRQLGYCTPGHPEYKPGSGIETTTGPLGQGLANAVGMAIAERLFANEFGEEITNHRTWVIAGDGCLMEGISHEAASLAGHLKLGKLIVLFDDNHISIDGDTALSMSDDVLQRFRAYGWETLSCDGHHFDSIDACLVTAQKSNIPTLIACRTTIGKGAPNKQGNEGVHGSPLGATEVAATRAALNWNSPPFEIPCELKNTWMEIGQQGETEKKHWESKLASHPQREEIQRRIAKQLPLNWDQALKEWQQSLITDGDKPIATREASGKSLTTLISHIPELLGGSADLTTSNNTHVGQTAVHTKEGGLLGRYLHYGVREHAMAAAMNGIALHGGYIPYGGTFLVFSDYCRPSLRLSAMMGIRVIYILTHDSIGLGEDGPTHQPVEHLSALRAIPNLQVYRPCDAAETAECWKLALSREEGPSVLALSRQKLPLVSAQFSHQCNRGGYLLSDSHSKRNLTIAATGSEVSLALDIQAALLKQNINAAVVSIPCIERLVQQDKTWLQHLFPTDIPLMTIEAATRLSWQALASFVQISHCSHLSIDQFGDSGKAADLFSHFGFTVEQGVLQAQKLLSQSSK